jgi:hypothetical protein
MSLHGMFVTRGPKWPGNIIIVQEVRLLRHDFITVCRLPDLLPRVPESDILEEYQRPFGDEYAMRLEHP